MFSAIGMIFATISSFMLSLQSLGRAAGFVTTALEESAKAMLDKARIDRAKETAALLKEAGLDLKPTE